MLELGDQYAAANAEQARAFDDSQRYAGDVELALLIGSLVLGIGLMVYSYVWGPVGVMKKREPLTEADVAQLPQLAT